MSKAGTALPENAANREPSTDPAEASLSAPMQKTGAAGRRSDAPGKGDGTSGQKHGTARRSSGAAGRKSGAAGRKSNAPGRRAGIAGARISTRRNSRIINGIAFGFSAALLLAAFAGALYTGTGGTIAEDFSRILLTPSPAVTDYYNLGSLPSALLNAGLCGMAMAAFMIFLPGPSHGNTMAGYFLVIAHCFFGLHFLNMWPCFLAPFLYLAFHRLDFKENLHVCMFATCFSPLISELLFRYALGAHYVPGEVRLTVRSVLLTLVFTLLIGFIAPAVLPGVKAWHKGYNLYNGGLAYGLLGFLCYSFLYRTMGVDAPTVAVRDNPVYDSFGASYQLFGNVFFLLLFAACFLAGWILNGRSLRGIRHLCRDTGYESNFAGKYGMPLCLINIGLHGTLFLLYVNLAVLLTDGAGFTAPTFGVIFAALTFTAMGQHVRNVWPILLGYPLLSLFAHAFSLLTGTAIGWSISTQGYINSAAFATGLCPIVGRYGTAAGIAAGMLCASICSSTAALHGGLILYNSGFTAGITALILLPILEHYVKSPKNHLDRHVTVDMRDMIAVEDKPARPRRKKKRA